MSEARFDLIGIGNAIVDVLARTDDRFLDKQALRKGAMTLIDRDGADALYASMPPTQEASGGSVANSVAVAAGLGARAAFLGKVADDQFGTVFRHDMRSLGVHFPTAPLEADAADGVTTARCLVLVTPDGQRTMNTYLGAGGSFGAADLDLAAIADAAILYLEGYLFDSPSARAAFAEAIGAARKAGRKVALSLSDPFCVDRHRDGFLALIADGVDIVFANETEICSLFEQETFDAAADAAAQTIRLAALTRSEQGSVIVSGDSRIAVPAAPAEVVDTTGAGDAYAAGFLLAHARGLDLAACGALGAAAAAEAISRLGARPDAPILAALGRQAGLDQPR